MLTIVSESNPFVLSLCYIAIYSHYCNPLNSASTTTILTKRNGGPCDFPPCYTGMHVLNECVFGCPIYLHIDCKNGVA